MDTPGDSNKDIYNSPPPPPPPPPPTPPIYYAPPPPPQGNALGMAGMIIGIVAAVLSFIVCLMPLTVIMAIVGLILSIVGLVNGRKSQRPTATSITGIVLNAVALLISLIFVLWVKKASDEFKESMSKYDSIDSSYQKQIQEAMDELENAKIDTVEY